ncbi:MAG: hypothetical protein ACLRZH_09100 [Ruthenibacterium lactatiformans]
MEPTTHNLEITNDALACRMFSSREKYDQLCDAHAVAAAERRRLERGNGSTGHQHGYHTSGENENRLRIVVFHRRAERTGDCRACGKALKNSQRYTICPSGGVGRLLGSLLRRSAEKRGILHLRY